MGFRVFAFGVSGFMVLGFGISGLGAWGFGFQALEFLGFQGLGLKVQAGIKIYGLFQDTSGLLYAVQKKNN